MVPVRGDFDGDGRDDLAFFSPADGRWSIVDSITEVQRFVGWGAPGDIPVPGDYDGDGRTDVAVWRPTNGGAGSCVHSSTGHSGPPARQWGAPGDIPVPGDYDGDGRTDVAVWRPSNGRWTGASSSRAPGRVAPSGWGGALGDIPVPADYDGDGRTDVAVWRPTSGEWFIVESGTGQGRSGAWERPATLPVPADYDGDGRADLAVWRPLPLQGNIEGVSFIVRSSDGGAIMQQWGAGSIGDKPIPLDRTGNGAAELGIYRTSTGQFFVTPAGP